MTGSSSSSQSSADGLPCRCVSCTKRNSRLERVAIGRDRARARVQLLDEAVAEERLQGRGDQGHDCASWAVSSRPAAQARSSGAADR